jgi:membrane protein implicated in regulation of membrane protease activity
MDKLQIAAHRVATLAVLAALAALAALAVRRWFSVAKRPSSDEILRPIWHRSTHGETGNIDGFFAENHGKMKTRCNKI